jgi:protein SCO1/2
VERGNEKTILGLAILLLSLASAARAQDNLQPVENVKIQQRLNNQVPLDQVFRDESGRRVALKQYFDGKPVVLVLAYYRCPRLCSLVLNKLTESLRQIDYDAGKQFTVIVVSIDPREQPELAAAKKQAHVDAYGRPGTADGWHFLTGDEESISRVADSVGFRFLYDPRQDQFAHASGIMVLTPEGKVSRYFYGLDYPSRDLRFGLEDASSGRIGSPVSQPLRLLCYAYDPVTGRYRLLTIRLVQGGAIVTIVAIGTVLGVLWRRERRKGQNVVSTTG